MPLLLPSKILPVNSTDQHLPNIGIGAENSLARRFLATPRHYFVCHTHSSIELSSRTPRQQPIMRLGTRQPFAGVRLAQLADSQVSSQTLSGSLESSVIDNSVVYILNSYVQSEANTLENLLRICRQAQRRSIKDYDILISSFFLLLLLHHLMRQCGVNGFCPTLFCPTHLCPLTVSSSDPLDRPLFLVVSTSRFITLLSTQFSSLRIDL